MDIRFRVVGEAVEVILGRGLKITLTLGQEAGARDALFLAGEARRKRLFAVAAAVKAEREAE